MAAVAVSALGGFPRVNLMPRSEVARRERDKLTRAWVWGVLGAIIVAVLIIAAAFYLKWSADQRLAAEQAQSNQLLLEIASLSEVSEALAAQAELTAFRSESMAADLVWAPVIAKVTGVLPGQTRLTGYDFAVGGAPQSDDPTAEQGLVGTVSFDSPTPLDIVGLIRSLRGVEGVLFADGQSVTSSQVDSGRYAYLLNVVFDQSIYSGAFAAAAEGEN
ncbi:hypothetical protein [uncultured Microbacterium sp.]|uniref:hypothetical protein n=1 Tax=uncultured Microbacterium sp. TaxID=191216 RepID=UPI0028D715B0|nr:hypothetical protein [uncultured Microbacterium sp.]